MNKFIKYCLSAAGVFLILGVIICAVCFAFGGKKVFAEAIDYTNDNTHVRIGSEGFKIFEGRNHSENIKSDNGVMVADNVYKFAGNDFDSLEVSFGAGEVIINESEDEYAYVLADTEIGLTSKIVGDRLVIKSSREDAVSKLGTKNQVTISLPKNKDYKKVALEIGACECRIDKDLKIENVLEVEIGAGELIMGKVEADTINVELGAGAVSINSMKANKGDFEVGMGSIEAKGDVLGKLDVECSLGSVDLVLDRKESEYNIDLECSMGSVEIGDKEYAGFATDKKIKGSSDTNLRLECAMGSICVDFN